MNETVLAIIIGAAATIFAAIIGSWLGNKYAKAQKEEEERVNFARSLGRVESGGSGFPTIELMRTIGELQADVRNIREDVLDIKLKQEFNRNAGMAEHNALREYVQGQLSAIKTSVDQLKADVAQVRTTLRHRRSS